MSTKQDSAQPLHDATKQREKHDRDEERETNEKKERRKKADCFPTMRHTQQTLLYIKLPPLLVPPIMTTAAEAAAPAVNDAQDRHPVSKSIKLNKKRSQPTPSQCKQLNGDVNRTRSLDNTTHYQRSSSYLRRATTVRKQKGRTER